MRNWYGRYERPISSLSLVGGFVFDAITLKRVDTLWENIWVAGHIFIVAYCMILIHTVESDQGDEANPGKMHFWLVNILQFFFGGLLSTFLVFYFRSGDLSASWPFILILSLAFWANESLKRRFVRLSFQVSLLFFSIFLFAIFLVPVVTHQINSAMFLVAGIVSLASIAVFLYILARVSGEKFRKNRVIIFTSITAIYLAMNALYFSNLIPPIPLSIKDAGVFHSVGKMPNGNYLLEFEDHGLPNIFKLYEDFHATSDTQVFAYTAVFSPTSLNTTVMHEWERYDEARGEWELMGIVNLHVVGGRDGGFRTYSTKDGLTPGRWRVNVETVEGHLVGRLRFTIVDDDTVPELKTKIAE